MIPNEAFVADEFRKWIKQPSGIDFRDYGDRECFAEEARRISGSVREALEALEAFEQTPFSPEIMEEALRAFSGRLSFSKNGELEYCVGQYFPTEYAVAAKAVLKEYVRLFKLAEKERGRGKVFVAGTPKSMTELKQLNAANGMCFFDPPTMKFFNSRVYESVFAGKTHWFFVTSEKYGESPRKYTVRAMDVNGDVETPKGEEFQAHKTLRDAVKQAEKLAFA